MSQFLLLVSAFQVWTWCKIHVSTLVSVQLQLPLMAGSNSWGTSYDLPSQERTVKLPSRQRVSFIQVWTQKNALEMCDFNWKTMDFYHHHWFFEMHVVTSNSTDQPSQEAYVQVMLRPEICISWKWKNEEEHLEVSHSQLMTRTYDNWWFQVPTSSNRIFFDTNNSFTTWNSFKLTDKPRCA